MYIYNTLERVVTKLLCLGVFEPIAIFNDCIMAPHHAKSEVYVLCNYYVQLAEWKHVIRNYNPFYSSSIIHVPLKCNYMYNVIHVHVHVRTYVILWVVCVCNINILKCTWVHYQRALECTWAHISIIIRYNIAASPLIMEGCMCESSRARSLAATICCPQWGRFAWISVRTIKRHRV